LKLSLSQPKPKALRLTIGSTTPTPNLVGGTIDNDSLRRQKQEMGEALSRVHRGGSKNAQVNGSTPVPSSAAPSIRRSISLLTDQADTNMTDVKVNGNSSTPQPHEGAQGLQAQAGSHGLPTPVQEVEPATLTNGVNANGAYPGKNTAFNYMNQSVIPMERRFRDPGRGRQPALLARILL
jgi:hypothetical protein